MKLSEFKGEEAVEVLADIIDPIVEISQDEKIKSMRTAKGTKVIDIAKTILKEHKRSVLDIYSIINQDKADNATPITLLQVTIDLLNDSEVSSLFSLQGQNEENDYSGSVMENTEEKEQ